MDHSKQAVALFNKYAREYEGRFMDVSLYHQSLNFFCRSIDFKQPQILELACGPGNITKYLLSQRSDLQILGTDLSPNMLELAKPNNPTARFQLLDAREISQLEQTFHGIMCGFCLPYLSMEETHKLIRDASKLLSANGVLYLSTMEDDYSKSEFKKGSQGDEIFMHFYTEKDLKGILVEAGFELVFTERVESVQTNGSKVIDLILIAKKIGPQ